MTDSSMLKFQYGQMLDQLILLQLHAEDPNCPCSLTGPKQGELGEYCEPKHLRAVVALARETISMEEDEARVDYLEGLVLAGTELLAKMEAILCGKELELGEYATWARDKRKPLEELCYSSFCEIASSTELAEYIRDDEIIRLFDEPRWCFGVKEVNKSLGRFAKDLGMARSKAMGLRKKLEMPISICKGQAEMFVSPIAVLDPYGSRCRDSETGVWLPSEECGFEPAGITTSALGMDGLAQYDFEFRVVSLDKLIVSHNPFTFVSNPEYPKELQPRLRERAATKIQVEKIAANLEPDAVLTDFHTLDRGAPIIGPDWVVEAGNGRVMGIMRAARDFPEKYGEYRTRLKERAADFGLRIKDMDTISNPILIRVRITDVDRAAFTQEANSAATIAPSAIENARVDAQKITTGMLQELVVGENQSLEDALRSPRNQAFANRFLKTLPENIQASLVDAHGYLNRDGVHRMAMAVFVSAFQGDTGLRLAEKAFESIDMDVRNAISSIARSLGLLAQAEALIRSGDRDTKLSIGDDLAQVVTVYSAIKRTPELTVEKYLAQGQLQERELTDFEEKVLVVFEKYRRSPKKLGAILSAYAQKVIDSPPPAQATLLPGAVITKEQLWESAVKAGETQPALMEETCERPSDKFQYLSTFFTESAPEAALFATEPGKIERKIDTVLAQLESGIEEIQESSKFKEFIDTMSKFHDYSLGNIVLITIQSPGASRIAGYRTWQDLGRNVKKGEHGIMILAPCFPPKPKKEEEDEKEIEPERRPTFFKVVHVFDIAQTEGKDLPGIEVPIITGEETGPLFQNALTYVAKQDITVSSVAKPEVNPALMGYWSPGEKLIWVRPDVPQDQRTKTLLHETAHAMCQMRGARDAEVMAESVAYTVANHFGYDTGVRSFPYVAVWARDVKLLKNNLETIRKVARDMIEGIEKIAELAEVARLFAPMKLLTKKIRDKLPPLYSQEKVQDPIVQVKFFTPDSNWTWYGIEFDGKDLFFGWVVGLEKEMGYFSLKELKTARGPLGLAIERDKWFTPLRLSEVKKLHQDEEAEMSEGIGQAVITGLGLGIGFKAIDELAKFVGKKEAEMGDYDKATLIADILEYEAYILRKVPLDEASMAKRAKELAKDTLEGLNKGYREVAVARYERQQQIKKLVLKALGRKVPAYLAEQAGNETSSAGFSLDPREEKPEDVNRFYAWTDKASTDEVLGELCERADYLGAHLCIAKEGDEVDREWTGKCPYIGTEDVYSELGRLRFLCWKLTQKLPSSVMIIGGKEAAVTDKAIRTKFMETAKDAVERALAKLDKVVKVGWEEKLAGDERAILDRLLGVWTGLTEDLRTIYLLMGIKLKEEAPYATQIPKDVVVFKTTIEKHYRPVGDFHKDSIRIVKPKSDILVTLGCLKKDKWDAKTATCSPNPTVLTTVVPNNKGYMDELKHLKLVHPEVKVKYRTKEAGVEPRVNEDRQEELVAIDRALENVEVVD